MISILCHIRESDVSYLLSVAILFSVLISSSTSAGVPVPLGDEFQVNPVPAITSIGSKTDSVTAMSPNGSFIVAWEATEKIITGGGEDGIYAQRFDVLGNPIGPVFNAGPGSDDDERDPAVAMDGEGRSVLVWHNRYSYVHGISSVVGQWFDAGGARIGPVKVIASLPTSDDLDLSVAMNASGALVAVWEQPDGDGTGIFARRYDSNGNAIGDPFQVNELTVGNQTSADVGIDDDGSFIVTWTDDRGTALGADILARLYDATGNPLDVSFQVNTTPIETGETLGPSTTSSAVSMDSGGNFVVAWMGVSRELYDPNWGIWFKWPDARVQRYAAGGIPLGSEFIVTDDPDDPEAVVSSSGIPDIQLDDNAGFQLAWNYGYAIYSRPYHVWGGPLADSTRVDSGVLNMLSSPSLAMDSSGNSVYVWEAASSPGVITWDVYARRYGADFDTDGIADENDNCLLLANAGQLDGDNDGYGNLCDGDLDNSGQVDAADQLLFDLAAGSSDPVADLNGDGIVDGLDQDILTALMGSPPGPSDPGDWGDRDKDGVSNVLDNCSAYHNPDQADLNSDGMGDRCHDSDNDDLLDESETSLGTDPTLSDTDDDGLSDGLEVNIYGTDPLVVDSDGDGLPDGSEVTHGSNPLEPDTDSDGDGIANGADNCIYTPNADQLNTYGDTVHGDACEVTVTGIWPADADIGDTISVFIFGNNFTTDGSTTVIFSGYQQSLVSPVSSEMLIVRVTVSEELYGPVTVITPDDSDTGFPWFGTPLAGLNLTGIWPSTAPIGENSSIFIFGTEFTTDNMTEVYFNGVRQWLVAPVTSEMLIVRVLGDAALSGTVTVTTPSGTVNSAEPLIFVP